METFGGQREQYEVVCVCACVCVTEKKTGRGSVSVSTPSQTNGERITIISCPSSSLYLELLWSSSCHVWFVFQYPELLVASYNNNAESPHEPDGVALVWNIKYKKTTPEFVFHCQVSF